MEKIFCIGFPKTGTTSLEEALELLGYIVCKGHYNNNHTNYLISLFLNKDYSELDKLIDYYDAFTDLPWGGTDFYIYLSHKYPNAKFIHTQRESEQWYDSFVKMITQFDDNFETAMDTFHRKGRYGVVYYINKMFKVETLKNTKAIFLNHYNDTNEHITNYFKETNFSYLEMNLVAGEEWEILCPFLNKDIPDVAFPHSNKAKENKQGSFLPEKREAFILNFLKKLKF